MRSAFLTSPAGRWPLGPAVFHRVLPALCASRQMAGIVTAHGSIHNATIWAAGSSRECPCGCRNLTPQSSGRRDAHRRRVASNRSRRRRDRGRARVASLRMRRRSPPTGSCPWWLCCRKPPEQVAQDPAALPRREIKVVPAGPERRCRGRFAARGRRIARHGEVQSDPRNRFRKSRCSRRTRCDQPCGQRCRLPTRDFITHRIHPRRLRARSAATWRKIPAACCHEIRHDHQ